MNPTLMQDLAASIAADARRDGERARAAGRVARRARRAARGRPSTPQAAPGPRAGGLTASR
jgi:hypothetical protein